ncbi:acyltransferase family protein [Rhizobium sp. PAMB 3174]
MAAMAVLALHCRVPLAVGGAIGVDIFFVLSGYLITGLLVTEFNKTGAIGIRRFYVNRAIRLFPPLFLMLSAFVLIVGFLAPQSHPEIMALLAAFYVTDYSMAIWNFPQQLGHTWSLSVEEQFYLIWPFVILVLAKLSRQKALAVLIGLLAASIGWRAIDAAIWGSWEWTNYRFDTHMSGLVMGSLAAMLDWRPKPALAAKLVRRAGSFLLVAIMLFPPQSALALGLLGPVVEVSATLLILALAAGAETATTRILSSRPFVYMGLLSYSIYLWHYPFALALNGIFPPVVNALIVSALSIAVSAASYQYVERPLRDVRRRLRGRRQPIEASVTAE